MVTKRVAVWVLFALFASQVLAAPLKRGRTQVPTTGFVDPTVATFNSNKPLVSCTSACSTSLVNQNTDALQAALNQAATGSHPWVYLPPGNYPVARGGAAHNQFYGLRLNGGQSGVVVIGYGATLTSFGDLGGSDFIMWRLDSNVSNVRIYGLTFSQAGMAHSPEVEQSHMLQFGVSGNTGPVDNIQVVDCTFRDGYGGDAVHLGPNGTNRSNLSSRIFVHHNTINGRRSGIGYQHGTSIISIVDNTLGPNTTDQLIDHESTSPGGNNFELTMGNYFERPTTIGTLEITIGGNSSGDSYEESAHNNIYAYNKLPNGDIEGLNTYQTWLVGNQVDTYSTTLRAPLNLFRQIEDTWVVNNTFSQHSQITGQQQLVRFENSSNIYPANAWVRGNSVHQFIAGGGAGIFMDPARDFWIIGNRIVNHNADATFNGILALAPGTTDCCGNVMVNSGHIAENTIVKTSGAGNFDVAFKCAGTSTSAIGFCRMRDNTAANAAQLISLAGNAWPEGRPVVTGNQSINVSNSGLATGQYVIDSTNDIERVNASGALAVSAAKTLITGNCGSVSDTLADGVVDGFTKTVEINSTCDSTGTLTPTHLGDGTSISWATTAGNRHVYFELAWDATSGTWRVLNKSSGITVNP